MKQSLLALILSIVTVLNSYAYDAKIDGIYYNFSGTEATVTCLQVDNIFVSVDYSGDIIIPSTVEYKSKNYKVTSIGECAFAGCSSLTSITIPESVNSIGKYAFEGCTSLAAVHITNLEAWCNIKYNFGSYDSNPLSCAHRLYLNGKEIKELLIPNSVTSIASLVFYGCTSLTSITIPNSVTSIGRQAFEGCSSLISVTIPNSVTEIGSGAFEGCASLTSITIPNAVTRIADGMFQGCSSLISITIPNSITKVGAWAFEGCSSLTSIIFPHSVTSIGAYAFQGCKTLCDIYSFNPAPPTCDSEDFAGVNTNTARLHIPLGTKDAYASAECWRDFKNILEENLSSIAPATTDRAHTDIYNIQGVKESNKTHTLRKGFYIVDGKKVYVK